MFGTKVRWARIEYQLDLRSDEPKIPLGVLVLGGGRDTGRALVAGRAPRAGSPAPDALKSVGPLGRSQLDGWVAAMAKDVLAALEKRVDPLESLAATWCWNLSVTPAEDADTRPGDTMHDVAARLYARHLGAPLPQAVVEPLARADIVPAHGEWTFAEAMYAAA